MNTIFQLRKVRDFSERIGDTLQFIKLHWIKLLGLYAVFVVPFLLCGIILGANSIGDFITRFSGSLEMVTGSMGLKLMAAAVFFLFAGASYSAVVYLFMDHVERFNGDAPTIPDIAGKFMRPFLFNIGYSVLVFFVLAFIVVAFALGIVSAKVQPLLVLVTMPVCFFLALFAMVFILMMFPVNVIGNGSFGSAIPGTFSLLKGRWWFSIGFVIILFIIYYFFSLAINTMVNLVFGLGAINMMDPEKISGMGKSYAYIFGLTTLVQQVFYLIIFVGSGIHYYSTEEEKAGAGLEKQIENIGNPTRREKGSEEAW